MAGVAGAGILAGALANLLAIIQVGAIAAVFVYFRADIVRLATGWSRGLASARNRRTQEWRFGWHVIAGSVPIGVVGLAGRHLVEDARSLWFVAGAPIGWSAVMALAEHVATQARDEADLRLRDVVWIGVIQCIALIPGVSRCGLTISHTTRQRAPDSPPVDAISRHEPYGVAATTTPAATATRLRCARSWRAHRSGSRRAPSHDLLGPRARRSRAAARR